MAKELLTSLGQLKPRPATYKETIEVLLKSDNPRLGEVDFDKSIAAIAEVMETVYAVMGFREVLEDKHGGKMLEYIWYNYKELHPVELEIAFDLTAKGAIKADVTILKGYNIRYLSHVLNAYMEMRKNIAMPGLKNQKAVEEVKREKDNMKPEDYKKMHEENAKLVNGFYEAYLKDPFIPFNDYRSVFVYAYLMKRGIITAAIANTKDVKERAVQLLGQRKSKTGIGLYFDEKDIADTSVDIVVADQFSRWKSLQTNVYEFLTKELK